MKHYVYTLAYPESMGGAVFYVGKGIGKRIDQHELEARRESVNSYKCNVIRKVWASGEQIVKTILAYFDTHEEALQYEVALIFFMDGLTNLTYGGDGNVGWIPSEDARRKMGEARKGHWLSEEYRQKMIDARKGRKLSAEARHNISEGHKGLKHTEEERRKMSEANKTSLLAQEQLRRVQEGNIGRKLSEEHQQKLSEAHKTSTRAQESRRKTAEANKGRKRPPRSEEWCRKISEAKRRFDPRFA